MPCSEALAEGRAIYSFDWYLFPLRSRCVLFDADDFVFWFFLLLLFRWYTPFRIAINSTWFIEISNPRMSSFSRSSEWSNWQISASPTNTILAKNSKPLADRWLIQRRKFSLVTRTMHQLLTSGRWVSFFICSFAAIHRSRFKIFKKITIWKN